VTPRIRLHREREDAPAKQPSRQGPMTQWPADESNSALLALQRVAGNQAVAQLIGTWLPVQRHPDTLPEVATTATQTPAAYQQDLPTADEKRDLLKERSQLQLERRKLVRTPARKRTKAENDRLAEIDERLKLIKHRLRLRIQGDATKDEEKTLQINGITGGAAAWFGSVLTVKFLDQYATVHNLLAARLTMVEAALRDVPKPAEGWVQEEHSSLRGPGQGLHAFGLAIDLNPSVNPWLINPEVSGRLGADDRPEDLEQSTAIRDIVDRAVLLTLGRSASDEALSTRPADKDKNARVEASYNKLAEASGALKTYMTLDAALKRLELDRLVAALGGKDPQKRTAVDWSKAIADDRATLTQAGSSKSWDNPQTGFLHIDRRLVKAMTDSGGAGLTWLGDDTIAMGRDIMHFDMRGLGPIKKVWKGGHEVNLGDG
jgi:hypothetical protein